MGRSARQEAIVKLRDQIAVTTNPKLLIQLAKALTALLLIPATKGRPRKEPLPDVEPESDEEKLERMMWATDRLFEKENTRREEAGLPEMTNEEHNAFLDGLKEEDLI
jgi:hypothetical protein